MTKHKLLLLTAVVLLVFSGIAGAGATESHITTVADLQAIQNDLGGTYYLDSDLDLSGVSFTPLGNESTPFTGTSEGNVHTIHASPLNPEPELQPAYRRSQDPSDCLHHAPARKFFS